MKNGGGRNKRLIGVLIILVVVAIGLIIGIIVVNINNAQVDSQNETTSEEDDNYEPGLPDLEAQKQYVENYENDDVSYQISSRITEVYNSGNKDEAMRMYDTELNKALAEQKYHLYNELVGTRSEMLFLGEECEKAVELYDAIDVTSLPTENQISLYGMAVSDSANCGNTDKEEYWNNKYNELVGDRENEVDMRP